MGLPPRLTRVRLVFSRTWPILAAAAWAGACGGPDSMRPIVLVTVDALRADHVGFYGTAPLPTPNMDQIGREGAAADYAVAPFGRTTQSIGTILTGLHPLAHGADGLGMQLPGRVTTIAEVLRLHGYDTAAFVSNIVLRPGLGFEQGFDIYSNPRPHWENDSAHDVTAEALAWAADPRRQKRPWFLWLHYLDPHWTYEPASEFARLADPDWAGGDKLLEELRHGRPPTGALVFGADRLLPQRSVTHVRRLYAGEVASADHALGQLLAGLDRLGLLDRSIVILTADHGESLGEHRYWFAHGEYIYEESLRVPLFIRAPGLVPPGTRIGGVVPLQDLAPTLLDLVDASPAPGINGESLARLLRQGGTHVAPPNVAVHLADHLLVRDENPRRPVRGREGRWWAIRDGAWKLIRIPTVNGQFQEELYNLAGDPRELHDLLAERPEIAARLRQSLAERQAALLARWQTSAAGAEVPTAVDPETLRSLGYVR